jgi:hypothetical protein
MNEWKMTITRVRVNPHDSVEVIRCLSFIEGSLSIIPTAFEGFFSGKVILRGSHAFDRFRRLDRGCLSPFESLRHSRIELDQERMVCVADGAGL